MQVALSMLLALAMILFGAELFTNAVEWLGVKLHLGQGAVGSVLAALGTALPEAAVPVAAILLGGGTHAAEEVGIGGILGAPFLLVTLGSAIVAISLLLVRRRADDRAHLAVQRQSFQRDMTYFLIAYALSLLVGCVHSEWLHRTAPFVLVCIYLIFVVQTMRDKTVSGGQGHLSPLYLQWKHERPSGFAVLLQLIAALVLIVGGAQLLAGGVERIAVWMSIPPFVLSALLIPLATELPETLNSVVWIRQGKDALAMGNITGAMVFQSTLVPALGIWMTAWNLTEQALLTGGLTLAAGALIFGAFRLRGRVMPAVLFAASLLYWILPLHTVAVRYDVRMVYWIGWAVVVLLMTVLLAISRRPSRV
ncbi:sodium:calcium antiporter [Alicyclobacillus sp.]|uniref:sodium:calcium antiporter n=1 Tax=Alicyclobacillus sp. TaxID=61169 RepID=UPI0025BD8F25|nr:sodium:calcium antiporter [Alicyclobacillus sp.]MCL6515947.1 sodium:calcium antiporter [Alicyclobacillus sp.]